MRNLDTEMHRPDFCFLFGCDTSQSNRFLVRQVGCKFDERTASPWYLISSSGSVLIAITARVLNYRGFVSIDGRCASIECRLDMMQTDMKDLNKAMPVLEIDVALLETRRACKVSGSTVSH